MRKICRWPTGIWKYAQHCSLVEKGQLTLQWGATSYRSEWPSLNSWWIIDAGEHEEKTETLLYCWGSVSWFSHCGKQYESSSIKTQYWASIWSKNSNPEHIPGKKKKLYLEQIWNKGRSTKSTNWKWKWRDHNRQHWNTKDRKRLLPAALCQYNGQLGRNGKILRKV